MKGSSDDINSALESFREEWRTEVRSKKPGTSRGQGQSGSSSKSPARPGKKSKQPAVKPAQAALSLYEEAADMESRGNMGESMRLYQAAYRIDENVERLYQQKYFSKAVAPTTSAVPKSAPSAAPAAAATAAAPSAAAPSAAAGAEAAAPPKSHEIIDGLARGFAGLSIQPAPPPAEGMPAPPCPISTLPDEVLLHIMVDVAVEDVGEFVRLAQVCKHFAFLVATEERIWRRVCLGSEFGFAGIPRLWKTDLTWEASTAAAASRAGEAGGQGGAVLDVDSQESDSDDSKAKAAAPYSPSAGTSSLLASTYSGSWKTMWRFRPRIRFNGCYISVVNYIRDGEASGSMVTWNSPVHMCTYFRYLRFFRDGTCISLLTTKEPAEVVPHLTKENLELHRETPVTSLPSSVMQYARKGRWRLGSAGTGAAAEAKDEVDAAAPAAAAGGPPEDQPAPSEEDLFVETEGVGEYMYRLDLAIKTAGKGARNNKLVWKGFWSYNHVTDDWADFRLKTDKAFIFSRVKRFGL